ncbi:MAG: hypothetical protein NT067_05745 [Candidatus Diapherotrites archaeon]|nr:hypothetical protein [Candidatus Diapherotrites archaeon]
MAELKEHVGLKMAFGTIEKKDGSLWFGTEFIVSSGIPSRDFISTEEIRARIDSYNNWAPSMGYPLLGEGSLLGHINIRIEKNRKDAVWQEVYPFKQKEGVQSFFRRHGIAQVLEWRVLNEAKKQFPLLRSIRHADQKGMTALRDKQLKRRGSNPTDRMDFELEREKLRERIRKDTLEHRTPKIRPRPARKP